MVGSVTATAYGDCKHSLVAVCLFPAKMEIWEMAGVAQQVYNRYAPAGGVAKLGQKLLQVP